MSHTDPIDSQRSRASMRPRHVAAAVVLMAVAGCNLQETAADPPGASAKPQPVAAPGATSADVSTAPVAENEIADLVPQSASVRLQLRGDLDGDGDEDVLLVLHTRGDGEQRFKPRTLSIARRAADGRLEKAAENPKAILCEACGGMAGDPLQGIRIEASGFSLRFEGGSRELWSREYRFVYSKEAGTWLLSEAEDGAFDRADGRSEGGKLGPKDFGTIAIERFDPEALPKHSIP
jgi:hypothetical protein